MTELYIVRHGQTTANTLGLKQGVINDRRTYLSATGKRQATNLAAHFHPAGLTALYVSPLERTKQTATILNQSLGLPIVTDKRLLEISYGDWDGQQNADLMSKYPNLFYPLVNDVRPNYAPVANGETFHHVEERVRDFTKSVVTAHPTDRLLIVTHAFTVRSFAVNAVGGVEGLEVLEPDNCSVTKIIIEPHSFDQHLVYYNRVVDNQF